MPASLGDVDQGNVARNSRKMTLDARRLPKTTARWAHLVLAAALSLAAGCDYLSALLRGKKRIEDVGQFQSSETLATIEATENSLYGAGYSAFVVLDISSPTAPIQIGRLPRNGPWVYDVAESNDRAYLAIGSSGVDVIDVSTRSLPRLVDRVPLEWGASAVASSGDYIYAVGSGYVSVLDATDPAHTKVVGACSGAVVSYYLDIALRGTRVYVTGTNESYLPEVSVFDVSRPTEPWCVASFTFADAPAGGAFCLVDAANDTLYVAYEGVYAMDISDPAHPRTLWSVGLAGGVGALAVTPGAAFVCTVAGAALHVVYGREICNLAVDQRCSDIAVSGEYVYALGLGGGLRIYHYR